MKPSTAATVALMLLFGPALSLSASDGIATSADTPAMATGKASTIEIGDQTIGLAIGLHLPLFIFDKDLTVTGANTNPGASFSLTYQYYLSHGFALGGTFAGAFNTTIGDRNLFVAPLSLRAAYTWVFGSIELGLDVEAGAYLMKLDSNFFMGPFAKAGASAYWRVMNAWSIGIETAYWFIPEIHTGDYISFTRYGNALEVGIAAAYHL